MIEISQYMYIAYMCPLAPKCHTKTHTHIYKLMTNIHYTSTVSTIYLNITVSFPLGASSSLYWLLLWRNTLQITIVLTEFMYIFILLLIDPLMLLSDYKYFRLNIRYNINRSSINLSHFVQFISGIFSIQVICLIQEIYSK